MYSNHKIFTYWENPPNKKMPEYIGVCLNKLNRLSTDYSVVIITPKNIDIYLKRAELNENWKRLPSIAQRADCVRVAIMNKHGGLWVDADTVMLKEPDKLFSLLETTDFIYMKWDDGRVLNGYFLCKPNSDIMEEWLGKINLKLANFSNTYTWTAFGESLLTPLIKKYEADTVQVMREVLLPINIDMIPNVFFEDVDYHAFLKPGTVGIGLNHSYFCEHYPAFVLNPVGEKMIHQIIREARDE